MFLKDTNGDGKADIKKRVLNGFGTEDTHHHNLHTLRWGPDGRLYMNQSVYTRTDTETPRGVVRLKAGGGFRYNTDSMRLEIFFRGLWNSWGHQFDAYGQSFLTDGAGFAGVAYAFPGAALRPTPKTNKTLGLISPGSYPKFASEEIIYGDSYPPEWQGSIVTCDFRANRVTRFSLSDQGSGFVTKQEDDLLRTSAATFRPIDVKQVPTERCISLIGPTRSSITAKSTFAMNAATDGMVESGESAGRDGKKKKTEDLTKLSNNELFARLMSDDRYTRDQSRRVLLERKDQIVGLVDKWTDSTDSDFEQTASHLVTARIGCSKRIALATIAPCKRRACAGSRDPNRQRLADPNTDSSHPMPESQALMIYQTGVNDEHPRVRLETIRALGKLGSFDAAQIALQALNHPRDRFIDFAAMTTLGELSGPFMAALDAGQWKPDSSEREKQLEFVLTNIQPALASAYLSKHLKSNKIAKNGSGPWIELIGKAGDQAELTRLFVQAVDGGFDAGATLRTLNSLRDAQRLRRKRPTGSLHRITTLMDSGDPAIHKAAISLTGSWKLAGQVERLAAEAQVTDNASVKHLDARGAAIEALREIGKPAANALRKLAESDDLRVRRLSTIALATLDPDKAVGIFYETLAKTDREEDALSMWRGFLALKNGGKLLTNKFPQGGVSEVVARAGIRAAKDGGRNEPALIAALKPHANVMTEVEKLTPERIAMLVKKVEQEGDPERGESVYSRANLACVSCHAIGGVGGKVGPDMTSLGASAPLDYLVESVYDPNAKIKENYHSVIVATEDGKTVTGIEVESTDDELVVRNAENKLVRIPQDDILQMKAGKSLMPNGVVDRLTLAEQVDLIKFLSQLGKPGNFDASKGGVARVYEVLAGNHRVEQAAADKIVSGDWTEGWKPLLARVNGNISGDRLAEMTVPPRYTSLVNVYLRTEIEVANNGEVTFGLNGPNKAALWVDGNRVDGETSFKTNLKAGNHTVLVRLDAKALPTTFRLASKDVSFATE